MDKEHRTPRLWADIITDDDEPGAARLVRQDGRVCQLAGASPGLLRLLESLDGHHALPDLLRVLPEAERFPARALLHDLVRQELVTDSSAAAVPTSPDVLIIGGGTLARTCAAQLLATTTVGLRLVTPEPRVDGRYPDTAAALRAALIRSDPALGRRVVAGGRWPGLPEDDCALVLVATDTVQPDRVLTSHLIRHSLPFLPVLAHDGWCRIGPLADYQGGACLHCLDLTQADDDPAWPQTLEYLSRRPARPDAGLVRLAAALACRYAAWFLDGSGNALRSMSYEANLVEPGLARRRWVEHPDCACCWQPTAAPLENAA
ncbi:MAG: hypothetical protein FWC46_05040 [Actinomycetia bacterium]|nr:hypothetical protein [Actinomycetes bacterium]